MSQLVVRPGRNAARQAKKLKEIRKVKGAILWHERERKKRQELYQERWESKQAVIQRVKWGNENVKGVMKQALKNAKEDWQLGPLRPNRAIGEGADKYGALTAQQMQKPDIPVHTQRNRNEARDKRGLDLEYPLVVDDKKYFHIVRDDRVVVTKGREKGKIGIVQDIIERTHEVIVKGVNMQYYDSNVFNSVGEDIGPRRQNEVPLPLADVRLVVPYAITQNGQRAFSDVIVDKIDMKRHTTGIDPFTGTDYGDADIPKDHQYDPVSGLPIFHRYIAGTRHRIEWPWEKEEEIEDSGVTEEGKTDRQTWFRKTMGTLRHPITSIKRWRSGDNETSAQSPEDEETVEYQLEELERKELERLKDKPRSKNPNLAEAYDNTDTTRNIVEGAESMAYTLIAPPFPDTLGEELHGNIQEFAIESSKNKDADGPRSVKPKTVTEQGIRAREVAKARHTAAEKMKTPMQLRWELEHAKKLKDQRKTPLVTTEALMAALGQHMQKAKASKRRQGTVKAEELD